MYRVSFTGYRPEKLPFSGENDPMCVDLKNRLSNQIRKLAADGADEFFTGMARGVDMWAAEAVLALKADHPHIHLNALIPCPDQTKGWSARDTARYQAVLEACDRSQVISPRYTNGCMQRRNRALVDSCDVLIAVYDGKSGGTGYTVNYARIKDKKIIMIPPV